MAGEHIPCNTVVQYTSKVFLHKPVSRLITAQYQLMSMFNQGLQELIV